MNKKALFTSNTDDYKTPKVLYDYFTKDLNLFDITPFQSEIDYMIIEWNRNIYCNPPYSNTEKWINEIIKRFDNNELDNCIILIPSRTDTKYFNKIINSKYISHIVFLKGRLKFNDLKNSAPFPSCLIYLDNKEKTNVLPFIKSLSVSEYLNEYR